MIPVPMKRAGDTPVVGQAEDLLLENEAHLALAPRRGTDNEAVAGAQRVQVVDLRACHHQVAAVIVQAGEVEAVGDEIPMTGVFEVILINGVVDDPLQVTLRVAYIQLDLEVIVGAPTSADAGLCHRLSSCTYSCRSLIGALYSLRLHTQGLQDSHDTYLRVAWRHV